MTAQEAAAAKTALQESQFKFKVVEKRLLHHDQVADSQIRELHARLNGDPRIIAASGLLKAELVVD